MSFLTVRYTKDSRSEAGIDEAGRGCLWGPLYAAAVIWPSEEEWSDEHRWLAPQIKDSKKLSSKKRATLVEAIQALAVDYGIGIVTPEEIDSLGMTFANKLAFQRAIDGLTAPPERLLIDGIIRLNSEEIEQITIVDGDATYLSIAAASILAKEAHDDYIRDSIEENPDLEKLYSIGSSKGYGTEKHRKGILEYGKHAEHRNLFLRKLMGKATDCLITDD
jgi:ribonuclease HII